ncbi:MAG: permease prefix domain 1-containing protein [Planctomycetota bacterium]
MDIPYVVQRWLPLASPSAAAELDAEIREELDFHLEMRTRDNERAGMSPEEARRDAEQRFGDFEASRRACRKITLGPRLAFQRLQTALIVALIGAVIYQGFLLVQVRNVNAHEMELLFRRLEQLQGAGASLRREADRMSYLHWRFADPEDEETAVKLSPSAEALHGWNASANPLQHPWSDWRPLED